MIATASTIANHPLVQNHAFARWTRDNQPLLCGVLFGLFAFGVVVDLVMVNIFQVESISARCWDACAAHSTIQVAIVLAGIGIAWLVRGSKALIWIAGGLAFHLGSHF